MSKEISIFDDNAMNSMVKFSEIMAMSTIAIPKQYQGNPGNCMAVIMQAQRWGMDPYVVASKTHVVSGNLGYEAQLVNAVITSSNAIIGRFHYEYSEPEWKNDTDPNAWIRVGAVIAGEAEIQWGEKLYPSTVKVKNSPLWKTNPKQQCGYLAVKMWSRLYTPHVIMGVYTRDELNEISEKDITPRKSTLDIPAGTDTETGEIPDEKPAPPTVGVLKSLMSDCDSIDRMKAYSDLMGDHKESFSMEEQADLKSFYVNRCEALKAEDK